MSVQMIELEEVTMVETTDEVLEATLGGVAIFYTGSYSPSCARAPVSYQLAQI